MCCYLSWCHNHVLHCRHSTTMRASSTRTSQSNWPHSRTGNGLSDVVLILCTIPAILWRCDYSPWAHGWNRTPIDVAIMTLNFQCAARAVNSNPHYAQKKKKITKINCCLPLAASTRNFPVWPVNSGMLLAWNWCGARNKQKNHRCYLHKFMHHTKSRRALREYVSTVDRIACFAAFYLKCAECSMCSGLLPFIFLIFPYAEFDVCLRLRPPAVNWAIQNDFQLNSFAYSFFTTHTTFHNIIGKMPKTLTVQRVKWYAKCWQHTHASRFLYTNPICANLIIGSFISDP